MNFESIASDKWQQALNICAMLRLIRRHDYLLFYHISNHKYVLDLIYL